MPRGKYVNHKGRSRHFTSPEELQHQNDEESSEAETSSDDEEETEGATASSSSKAKSKPKVRAKKTAVADNKSDEDSDESDSEESEDDRDARKGVASLIQIKNPNKAVETSTHKLKKILLGEESAKPELSGSDRKQIWKQKARIRYNKLHAAGKTTQAKADLGRLALIRQQRADAAAKREAEKKASEDKKSTTSASNNINE